MQNFLERKETQSMEEGAKRLTKIICCTVTFISIDKLKMNVSSLLDIHIGGLVQE